MSDNGAWSHWLYDPIMPIILVIVLKTKQYAKAVHRQKLKKS